MKDSKKEQEPIYDLIAKEYRDSKQLPFRKYIEEYTLFQLLGKVGGKNVLDLACGEGFYTRKIKDAGASQILGIDISEEMIRLARENESRDPLGCNYIVRDASSLDQPADKDLVVSMYLLNYAKNREELLRFCLTAFRALKDSGIFIGLNDNIHLDPALPVSYRKYGFSRTSAKQLNEGDPIEYIFNEGLENQFQFENYYLLPDTFNWAFREAGFSDFEWYGPLIFPEAGNDPFWSDFISNPPIIGFRAIKK